MKVTKKITKTFEQLLKVKSEEQILVRDLYDWMNSQGIDTGSIDFADSIATRIDHNEFRSAEEFFEDLKQFIDGEQVGHG